MPAENTSTFEKPKVGARSRAELQKNILATIAYYDGMDYPLTAFEIWKYLINFNSRLTTHDSRQFSLTNIIQELDEYDLERFIEEHRGFYFLRGKKNLVEKRINAGKISAAKMRVLRRITWLLRFCPFLRMISVTGRLSMKNATEESDWDVLVALKKGRIWTGRTLVTIFTHLLGKRRYGKKIKDRICLNYFITDERLELITQDLFSSGEYFFCFPLFGADLFSLFQIKNKWIGNFRPNYYLNLGPNRKTLKDSWFSKALRGVAEKIFDWEIFERLLKSWQSRRIINDPRTKRKGSFVKISDDYLIFLPEPHGPELTRKLSQKLALFDF